MERAYLPIFWTNWVLESSVWKTCENWICILLHIRYAPKYQLLKKKTQIQNLAKKDPSGSSRKTGTALRLANLKVVVLRVATVLIQSYVLSMLKWYSVQSHKSVIFGMGAVKFLKFWLLIYPWILRLNIWKWHVVLSRKVLS